LHGRGSSPGCSAARRRKDHDHRHDYGGAAHLGAHPGTGLFDGRTKALMLAEPYEFRNSCVDMADALTVPADLTSLVALCVANLRERIEKLAPISIWRLP